MRAAHAGLVTRAEHLLHNSVSARTHQTYSSACRAYVALCHRLQLQAWPPTEYQLILFLAYLSSTSRADGKAPVRAKSLRVYLHAVGTYAEQSGHINPLRNATRLWRVWQGIKRTEPQVAKRTRLPLTTDLVRFIASRTSLSSPRECMLLAAIAVATYGLMRSGELTRTSHNAESTLLWLDIAFMRDDKSLCDKSSATSMQQAQQLLVTLRSSKADVERQGVTICIAASLPVQCLLRHALLQTLPLRSDKPVFSLRISDQALTRHDLVTFMRSKLRQSEQWASKAHMFSGHSFRRGGATSLSQAGVPESMIRTLGRWTSDCVRLYVQSDHSSIASASRRM